VPSPSECRLVVCARCASDVGVVSLVVVSCRIRVCVCGEVSLDFSTVSPLDDINTSPGFLKALTYILALEPGAAMRTNRALDMHSMHSKDTIRLLGGLIWAAPPCSSWVWVGRHQTERSRSCPMGNPSKPVVAAGNMQASRLVLLVVLVCKTRVCHCVSRC
jgi:hypothetical protein